jgi:hypothetical protein
MAKAKILTAARLREVLHYNPKTGEFTRLVPGGKSKVGRLTHSSCSEKRYLSIGIDYQRYQAHRLAFLYMTGKWPPNLVDHKNDDPLDNRWSNLRLATFNQNNVHRHKLSRRNKSGYTGVRFHKDFNRWQAIVSLTFKTKQQAIRARRRMIHLMVGEFAPPMRF